MWLFSGSSSTDSSKTPALLGRHSMVSVNPPTRTSAPRPRFPIELVLDILEIVASDDATRGASKATLANCAAVCKEWAPMCQALLFRDVALPTLKASIAFVAVINPATEKAFWLRSLVRSFEIIVSDEEDGHVITQFAFANIMKFCPNIEELRLFYYCLRPLDFNTLDVLRNIPAPKSLSLRCAQDPSPLWDLMSIWPSVQHLEVVSWETPTNQLTRPPTGRWAPYEVRWLDESDSAETTLPRLLRPGSLRILQLMKTPTDTFFDSLMQAHGPYLRSLRMREVSDVAALSLAQCENLEEFKYLGIPSREVLAALPASTIQHISIQNGTTKSNSVSIKEVIDWVASKATALKVITYNSCGPTQEKEYIRLVELCKAKKIDLQCFADTPPVRENEPLSKPTSFPRPMAFTPGRRPVSLTAPTTIPVKSSSSSKPIYGYGNRSPYPPGSKHHPSYVARSSDSPVVDVSNGVRSARRQRKRLDDEGRVFGIKLGL